MFEFIKKLFKREEPKRIPGVEYVEVDRVPIERVEVNRFDRVEKLRPYKYAPIWRYQYLDTGEIVEKPNYIAIDDILKSSRPVEILGSFYE